LLLLQDRRGINVEQVHRNIFCFYKANRFLNFIIFEIKWPLMAQSGHCIKYKISLTLLPDKPDREDFGFYTNPEILF